MKSSLFLILILSFNLGYGKDTCHGGDSLSVLDVNESFGFEFDDIFKRKKLKYKGFLAPSDLRKHDANTIAELLIDRIQEGCDKERGGQEEKSIGDNSEVMMMVNHDLYDSIDKYGFQNQHVTATTNGCNCREDRYRAEMSMLGNNIGYGSKSKDILPKYSGLNVQVKGHFANPDYVFNGASHYGNTAVVFKKNINERTTFTPWDSLGVRKFRNSPIFSSLNFKGKKSDKEKFRCDYSYCEAQIWGKVTLDDVAYVLIQEGQEVPEVFKKRGIPVYYKQEGKNGTMAWEKGRSAYSPKKEIANYRSPAIAKTCEDCHPVTKKVNDHHNYSDMNVDELMNAWKKGDNIDQAREMLGELAVRKFKGKKEFFEARLRSAHSKSIESMIYMQALVDYPRSEVLKEAVLKNLKVSPGSWGSTNTALMMAIALATELKPLKKDKEVQARLKDFISKRANEYFKHYYQYLTTDKNMCSELPKQTKQDEGSQK